MRTALVTGGGGFVGRALIALLEKRGVRTVSFGPTTTGEGEATPSAVETVTGSVLDRAAFESAVDSVQPDTVFHLAAFGVGGTGLIRSAITAPLDAISVNILGSATAFDVAAQRGLDRFIWSSSTSVFGSVSPHEQRPAAENIDPHPDTLYGATKRSTELLLGRLAEGTSTRCTGIRLPSVYGAGRYPGAIGDFTRFVSDVAHGRPTTIATPTFAVDWLHVVDAAEALITAAEIDLHQPIYNVVGHRSTLEEMANAVATHSTAEAHVSILENPSIVPDLMDPTKFNTEAEFKPRFDLNGGVKEYVHSERQRAAGPYSPSPI